MKRSVCFLLLLTGSAAAAVENLRVLGITNTQAVIAYRAPDSSACSVEVSESASFTPLAHDVNPVLFPGADLDSRSTSANRGRERFVVVGRRTIGTAADERNYSRALQAATIHYFRVRCGGDEATGTFQTTTLPLGITHTDPYIPDETYPGLPKYITVDQTNRNWTWIDPHTGVQARLLQKAGDWQELTFTNRTPNVLSGSNWTAAEKFTAASGTAYAVYDGADCGESCDGLMFEEPGIGPSYVYGTSTTGYKLSFVGLGSSSAAADRTINICMVPNTLTYLPGGIAPAGSLYFERGTTCDPHPGAVVEKLVLPEVAGTVSITSTFRKPGVTLHAHGFQETNTSGNSKPRFIVWKDNPNGTISIRGARFTWLASYRSNVGSGGGHDRCSSVMRTDGSYLCTAFQGGTTNSLYTVHGETGEVKFLGRLNYVTGIGSIWCPNDHQPFSETDPNVLYCTPSGNPNLGKFTFIGANTEKAPNYLMGLGVDFTVDWITDIPAKVQAFYAANEGAWDSILGGAGNHQRLSAGAFPGCTMFNVQRDHLVGYCRGGNQDSPTWQFTMDPTGEKVIGLTPSYANACSRWCSNHTQDVVPDQGVQQMTTQKFYYKAQLAQAVGPSDTTITLTSSCTGDCDGFHAGDPVSYSATHVPESLMPLQPGDKVQLTCYAGGPSTGCEYVELVSREGNTWTVLRGRHGTSATSHLSNAGVFPICASWVGSTVTPNFASSGMWVWDWAADPFGISTDGSGVWTVPYIGHVTTRGNVNVNNNQVAISAPGTKILEVDKVLNSSWSRWQPLGFGGEDGTGTGLTYQTHVAAHNINEEGIGRQSFWDGHPFIGGNHFTTETKTCNPEAAPIDVNPSTGCAYAKVPGYSSVYRYVHGSIFPFRPKHYATFAASGPFILRDISGPGSVISDATKYRFCVARVDGECIAGSTTGQMFVSTPDTLTQHYCGGGEGVGGFLMDICMSNNEWLNSSYTQTVYGIKNKLGMKNVAAQYAAVSHGAGSVRMIARHAAAGGYKRMPGFSTARPLANGKFVLVDWAHMSEGTRIAVLKVPPIQLDSRNRATFQPVIEDIPWVPGGTDNALIEFGYSEQGEPNQFRCTTRAETCIAHRSTVNDANPFSFAQSESYTGVPCANGCRITIPAYPGRMVYYRTLYRNSSNQVILKGPMRVIATP